MKKFVKFVQWFLIDGLFFLLVLSATVKGNATAAACVFWLTVIFTPLGLFMLWKPAVDAAAKHPEPGVLGRCLGFAFDIVVITLLVTYGFMFTSVIYACHTLILNTALLKTSEARKLLAAAE